MPEPTVFRGHVMACASTPTGREFVQVVNYRTGQMTLIPKTLEAQRAVGRTVQLSRDREDRLVLQLDRGISR